MDDRMREHVRALEGRGHVEVLVIGGGINGIATFRELARQGADVALVERGDFAGGTSAASSHMVHGGIRYLENGEFRLVRESVRERNRLLGWAPHRVRPLVTTVPIYSIFSGLMAAPMRFVTHRGGGSERGAVLIKIGLIMYDLFSRGGRVLPRHRFLGRERSLDQLPDLTPRVRFTATYYDAAMEDPERFALDVLDDALSVPGSRAIAANYVEAVGTDAGAVRLRDRESGHEFAIDADVVVNATGPWTDLTNAALGSPSGFLGGTKGSHIVVDHPELLAATRGREIFFEHADGRIVLIYPLKGRVLMGTTDLDADPGVPAECTDDEVAYFLDLTRQVFPRIAVDASHIVYRFAGIRPLPKHEDTQPGFVSRDYRIERGRLPDGTHLLSLVGGKWTTFRALGESLAAAALRELNRELRDLPERPLAGSSGFATLEQPPTDRARVLRARYGARDAAVARHLAAAPDTLLADGRLSAREISWMVEREHAVRLTDVVLRRTDLAFTGDVDPSTLTAVADVMAAAAGWDADRTAREVEECLQALGARVR